MIPSPDHVSQYKLDDKFARKLKRNYMLTAVCGWIFIFILNQAASGGWQVNGKPASTSLNLELNLILISVCCIITVVLIYINAASTYRGYIIIKNEKMIGRTNGRNQNLAMEFSKISYVIKTYKGSLLVYGLDKGKIIIPYTINGYSELEKLLIERSPVFIAGPYSLFQKYSQIIIFVFGALVCLMLALSNKIAVGLIAFLLIAVVIFQFKSSYNKAKGHKVFSTKGTIIPAAIFVFIVLGLAIKKLIE